MQHAETIIIGGGPAGSACAWHLAKHNHEVLMIDKASFPRLKLCAGWITQKVMDDLEFSRDDYPHPMLNMDICTHIRGLPIAFNGLPTSCANFSIRRVEFDDWLLKRAAAPVVKHTVKSLHREGDRYIIDGFYSCINLIGAGGTMCPVRRNLFPDTRIKERQIATLEKEFKCSGRADRCHLYFMMRGLQGYSWFVPKGNGFVNIGLGGKSAYFRQAGTNIHHHFQMFLEDLIAQGLLDWASVLDLGETGYPYFLYAHQGDVKRDRCYLIGDAAGLATVDMGEGIGPAIESGLMAAREILGQGEYTKDGISKYSFSGIAKQLVRYTIGRRDAF